MDVRCENCQVEYELEDSKLKASGVTVKCANCGHMFRIRKRNPRSTKPGAGSASEDLENRTTSERPAFRPEETTRPNAYTKKKAAPPAPFPPADKTPAPEILPRPPAGPEKKKKPARKWLVRVESGEVHTCHELATLQKWIVAGMVTRTCHISRTGKTWKPLGQITELKMFFDIAEEARLARVQAGASGAPKRARRTTASKPPPVPRPRGPSRPNRLHGDSPPAAPVRPTALGSAPPPPAANRPPSPAPIAPSPVDQLAVAATAPNIPPDRAAAVEAGNFADRPAAGGAVLREASERATGSWAAKGKLAEAIEEEDGSQGPVGGLAKGVPVADVAFAGKAKQKHKLPPVDAEPQATVEPIFDDFGDDFFEPARGGAGKWIVFGSLVVILGAAAVVYLLVFRDKDSKQAAAALDAATTVAETGAAATGDGGAAATPLADPGDGAAVAARQALLSDDTASLRAMATSLASAEGAETELALVVLRSRVEAALAQQILDRAAANADVAPEDAKQLKRSAKKRVSAAAKLASKAVELDEKDAGARVAKADSLRLQGKAAREVERWLQRAADDRDAKLVEALLQIRENRVRRARTLLAALDADGALEKTGDVRPRYRLALLDFGTKEYAKARDGADAVLAVQPGHTGSAVLVERVRAATAVVTTDPMPPEVENPVTRPSSGGSESYDTLLQRADKKAETGKCAAAMPIYQRALDANPSGVAALTGLGYCHLDAGQFASAQAKFRAALGISPRYQEALLGVAEAYQQQGLKDKAIAAYKRFIDEHPTSARARQAERQIEKLGGKVGDGSDSTDSSGGAGDDPAAGDSSGAGDTGDTGDSADTGDSDTGSGDKTDDTATDDKTDDDGASGSDAPKESGGPGSAAIDDLKPSPKPPAAADDETDDSGN